MKRFISVLLLLALICSMAACGSSEEESSADSTQSTQSQAEESVSSAESSELSEDADSSEASDISVDAESSLDAESSDESEPNADSSEPSVSEPDISKPEPDVSEPEPDVSEPEPDVSEPEPDISEPDVSEPEPDPIPTQKGPFDVIVNEVMPDNEILCLGHDQDWVELYNADSKEAVLDGFYLTDNAEKPNLIDLSGKTIPAGGFLVIVLDAAAPFRLSSLGETVYLTYDGKVASYVSFGAAGAGASFSKDGICPYATPGFENSEEGRKAYLATVKLPELIINEVMSSNSKYAPVNGKCYDLVEIYNNSDKVLNLADYTFSDKRSEPDRFKFPAVSLNPGEFYVIYCSGQTNLGSDHASFKISSAGETVYLAKNGVIFDQVRVPSDVNDNESYGRTESGFAYFSTPTIGKQNGTVYEVAVAAPQANYSTGFYTKAIKVSLTGEGTIYYTLDGSRPTTSSKIYSGPISVTDVTTIRTFCVKDGYSSLLTAYTYVINKAHDLPVVVLSIPQNSLTGSQGVLNNIAYNYEYESVVTLIENGEEKFSVPCGFRLHGNDSRKGAKQNFQLRFRSEYGAGKLRYPLFDDRNIDEYDSLLLKGGSEDWKTAMLRDELASAIVDGNTNLYALAIKPVVLYLGGDYWGIYYLRERFSDDYVAGHLNVSPESVDIAESTGAGAESGSVASFHALWKYVESHDMSKTENFEYLAERIDITSLMDWYICRSYMGDKDLANIRRFRTSEGDGKWYWMWYDMDWAFHHTTDQPLTSIVNSSNGDPVLIRALLKSKEGKDAFLKRYAELMGTILNDEHFNKVLDELVAVIESEIPNDRARWGASVKGWESAIARIRNYTKDGARAKRVLQDLKSYFNLSDNQMTAYFGDLYQP